VRPGSGGSPNVALLSAYPAYDMPAEARMRPRNWRAVRLGTLTGSALAITGNPHSKARPAATAAHLGETRTLTNILAARPLAG